MIDEPDRNDDTLSLSALERIERVCTQFEGTWKTGEPPRIEDFLGDFQGAERAGLLRQLILLDLDYRRKAGAEPTLEEYQARFPDDRKLIDEVFAQPSPDDPEEVAPGGSLMIDHPDRNDDTLSLSALERIERVCTQFERAWKTGEPPRIEDFLGDFQGAEPAGLLRLLILLDLDYRRKAGAEPTLEEYQARFPDDRNLIDEVFAQPSTDIPLAQAKLRGAPRGTADEEDVAAGMMASLFRAAEAGRFPNLADRDELWRLLLKMTARKVVDLRRRETRQRRGGGRVKGESALRGADDPTALAQVIGDAPTPEFAAMMVEECERLLAELADPNLKAVAEAKLEGYTNAEIAERLGCSLRTVERRLHLIRKKWERGEAP